MGDKVVKTRHVNSARMTISAGSMAMAAARRWIAFMASPTKHPFGQRPRHRFSLGLEFRFSVITYIE